MLDPGALRSRGPRQGEWSSRTDPGASGPRDFRLLWAGQSLSLPGDQFMVGAVLANTGTFVISVLTLLGIRHREQPPTATRVQRGWLVRDVRAGLAFVARHPLLEPVMSCRTVYVLSTCCSRAW